MKTETRNVRSAIGPWGSWIIFLLLCGHLIFCHGCHGDDVDDELCVPPPAMHESERPALADW
ncbi:MAG TPA: hypothetical protein VH592_00210 [Gemmataceae bacterium]|jgi:hypothetical protein